MTPVAESEQDEVEAELLLEHDRAWVREQVARLDQALRAGQHPHARGEDYAGLRRRLAGE